MTSMPLFSIVIPTRNRVGMVQRALQSVAAQTFTNYEIVVVDDGSTDATPAFLQSVRSAHCRVIRHEQGHGVSAARNRGVAAAAAELVTFLDDDDELRPCALEALHDRLASGPHLDFMWGGRVIREMDGAGRLIATRRDDWSAPSGPVAGSQFLELALSIATNSAFTIRHSVFDAVGGFDEQLRMSEDRDLFIRLAQAGYVGAAVARSLVDINEYQNSLSRSRTGPSGADVDLHVIDKHRDYLERPAHRRFLDRYLTAVFEGYLWAGNRRSAAKVFGQLYRRQALGPGIIRRYIRHAPEFRALKSAIRYDAIRRLRNRMKRPDAG